MMFLLVVKHIALVVISVLATISALESLLAHMDVLLVSDKSLPGGEPLSTVAAMELLVFVRCVHFPHVQLNLSELATTNIAG